MILLISNQGILGVRLNTLCKYHYSVLLMIPSRIDRANRGQELLELDATLILNLKLGCHAGIELLSVLEQGLG